MRIRRGLVFVPLLVLAACSDNQTAVAPAVANAASSSGGPSMDGPLMTTAGLWRTTTTVDGRQAFGANRACVSLDSQRPADGMGQDEAAEAGCSATRRRPIDGGYAFETVCEKDGVKTSVSGRATGDARRVTIVSATRITAAGEDEGPETTVKVESVHLGPCPSGMKPGDTIQEGVTAP